MKLEVRLTIDLHEAPANYERAVDMVRALRALEDDVNKPKQGGE